MNLTPGTNHVIRWTKQNLLDTATYYVKAIIRDTREDLVLDTFNLNNLGGGRFSRAWNVPQDPSGQGREIEVELTIYEDAAYTQVSAMYGRWTEDYLIYDFRLAGQAFGGGGGGSIDYRFLADSLEKTIRKIFKEMYKPEKTDLSHIERKMDGIIRTIGAFADAVEAMREASKRTGSGNTQSGRVLALLEESGGRMSSFADSIESIEKRISAAMKKDLEGLSRSGKEDLRKSFGRLEATMDQRLEDELEQAVRDMKSAVESSASRLLKKMESFEQVIDKPRPMQFVIESRDTEKDEKKNNGRAERLLMHDL